MKKGNKKTKVNVETVETIESTPVINIETVGQPQVTTEVATQTKKLGRPVVSGSARQIKMAEREAKLAAGELKRGRKPNPDSKRQANLERLAMLRAEGKLVINPEMTAFENLSMELVVASTEKLVPMIEAKGKQIKDEVVFDAIKQAHAAAQPILGLINDPVMIRTAF